jgi:hypothetical protein
VYNGKFLTASQAPPVAKIKKLLRSAIVPSGEAATIGRLLAARGYRQLFTAPEAGKLAIGWYLESPDARGPKTNAEPILVATSRLTVRYAGRTRVEVKLTRQGRKLLKHAKRLKLTGKGTFLPNGRAAIATTRTFTIRR